MKGFNLNIIIEVFYLGKKLLWLLIMGQTSGYTSNYGQIFLIILKQRCKLIIDTYTNWYLSTQSLIFDQQLHSRKSRHFLCLSLKRVQFGARRLPHSFLKLFCFILCASIFHFVESKIVFRIPRLIQWISPLVTIKTLQLMNYKQTLVQFVFTSKYIVAKCEISAPFAERLVNTKLVLL